MAKLGEMLVRNGLITRGQLDEALKNQVIFGGRLGTNLIEMGLLSEDQLGPFLAKAAGVSYVQPQQLMNIPPEVLEILPREIAEKHQVIPLRIEGRRLYLAMANPSDYRTIDEIAFRTGYIIKPALSPEVRLQLAMEKYYQVERKLRYIHSRDRNRPTVRKTADLPAAGKRPEVPKPSPASAASVPLIPSAKAVKTEIVEEFFEIEPTSMTESASGNATVTEKEPVIDLLNNEIAEKPESADQITLEAVWKQLTQARDREDIAETLIAYLGQEFTRAALFLVRGETASGWKGTMGRKTLPGFEEVQIPLNEPSVLKTVAENRSFFLGPIPRSPFNSMILQGLGGKVPNVAILVPLLMMGRAVAILYVDGGEKDLGSRLPDLQKLASKTAMAFDILIFKSKILA